MHFLFKKKQVPLLTTDLNIKRGAGRRCRARPQNNTRRTGAVCRQLHGQDDAMRFHQDREVLTENAGGGPRSHETERFADMSTTTRPHSRGPIAHASRGSTAAQLDLLLWPSPSHRCTRKRKRPWRICEQSTSRSKRDRCCLAKHGRAKDAPDSRDQICEGSCA